MTLRSKLLSQAVFMFEGGLPPFIEPWLGEALRKRLVACKLDAVHGAVLMVRKVVQNELKSGDN